MLRPAARRGGAAARGPPATPGRGGDAAAPGQGGVSGPAVRSWSATGAIRAIPAAQIAMAAVLVARDLGLPWPWEGPPAPAARHAGPAGRPDAPLPAAEAPGGDADPGAGRPADARCAGSLGGRRRRRRPRGAHPAGALEREAPERVALNSPGGSVGDALAIGRAIRAAGIATEVGCHAVCLSACPYLFLAAGDTERSVEGALVGVQQYVRESRRAAAIYVLLIALPEESRL